MEVKKKTWLVKNTRQQTNRRKTNLRMAGNMPGPPVGLSGDLCVLILSGSSCATFFSHRVPSKLPMHLQHQPSSTDYIASCKEQHSKKNKNYRQGNQNERHVNKRNMFWTYSSWLIFPVKKTTKMLHLQNVDAISVRESRTCGTGQRYCCC